ncbi:hypothetical protein C4D60_Mb03t04030 [Musa balbisiana]|uniref:Transcription factor CBF/NF-Y/archaeal histone domain-containing protein n=1 Tax=Musa balbisiana TaxID=52838 RepID=A0A4S8J7Q8_MUSBA|nr:hypothetical protein C4D60_Mb03t04030 [Musa balbisiana]
MELNPAAAAGAAAPPVVREQDRFMPIANVIRIMRRVLPAHAKIADDAKEMIQECVSEYISFITSEANERCQPRAAQDRHRRGRAVGHEQARLRRPISSPSRFLHHRPGATAELRHATASYRPDIPTAVSQFFTTAPVPPPNFVMPPPATAAPQHHNLLSESMVSYFLGMYGGGEGSSASGSYSHVNGMPNFDHSYPPYK